jgi:hypothetical protein
VTVLTIHQTCGKQLHTKHSQSSQLPMHPMAVSLFDFSTKAKEKKKESKSAIFI